MRHLHSRMRMMIAKTTSGKDNRGTSTTTAQSILYIIAFAQIRPHNGRAILW